MLILLAQVDTKRSRVLGREEEQVSVLLSGERV